MQQYSPFEIVVFGIIFFNVVLSMMSFGNYRRFEQLKFRVGDILAKKEYHRILSSAFLHANWMHLFLNMYVLYSFSKAIEAFVSIPQFFLIYFGSLLVGNLLPLYMHRNNYNYSAVGASGAVSGVLYASIFFVPNDGIGIIFLPFYIPSWLFGILYLVYTIYGIKKNNDNIGHDAHFGGAVTGLIIAMCILPAHIMMYWKILIAMMLPIIYFFTNMTNLKPSFKISRWDKNTNSSKHTKRSLDDLYNENRTQKIRELNELLDKVKERGIDNLSKTEKDRLDYLSKELE